MRTDQHALITGASRGLGMAIAKRLHADGIPVIGVSRNAPSDGAFPGDYYEVDLARPDEMADFISQINGRYRVTRLVNNVGTVIAEKLGEIDPERTAELFDLNLRTTIQATQGFLPTMREAQFGRILQISSITVLGFAERTSYAASKAALISFTRSWALELATTGITVNAIAPGPTETELFRVNSPPGSVSEARYMAIVPMKRFGRPAEIAAAASYVMSEDAGFLTGQTIYLDGGASIGRSPL